MRKQWLRRALRDYPVYDPPHKLEERLLSKERAAENFDYFMSVRLRRLEHLRGWLRRFFRVELTLDRNGVQRLNRWANKYAGLLLVTGPNGYPTNTYFDYQPSWIDDDTGCNVVFDMGIAIGESMIAQCPKLYWDMDPISAILPRMARSMKNESGTSFQRATITGFENPATWKAPLHDIYIFSAEMQLYVMTFKGIRRLRRKPRSLRREKLGTILSGFDAGVRAYANPRRDEQRKFMSNAEYFKLIDSQYDGEGEHE
ncbi:hypothetical protein [Burkholderia sp. Ac-20353]|uniref:hypothetical protein n=1 Tax=Burkholderia sp. Ac-20353 TaxID=2703894 RepID=UPI00197B8DF8|nr:hypothetical protein [Burkholderia sp. Ac-20353]MBN3792227.1 hypothetical protein [Burkholderia sp. Ac-20353]